MCVAMLTFRCLVTEIECTVLLIFFIRIYTSVYCLAYTNGFLNIMQNGEFVTSRMTVIVHNLQVLQHIAWLAGWIRVNTFCYIQIS